MATRVLFLGANGQLARNTTRVFLAESDATLTLYLRRASRLANPDPARGQLSRTMLTMCPMRPLCGPPCRDRTW